MSVLWIVATPLGNAGDLSPRARDVLGGVDMVLAEDTRRAGLLFKRLGIESKGFVSLFEHNEEKRVPLVLKALEQGQDIALISDAGTPLLSDPGYQLVRAVLDAGFKVSPVPGPSAAATALCACGLPPQPFTFLGFLPRGESRAKKLLAAHGATGATLVFLERKSRLKKSLETAFNVLGDREFCLAREMTKDYEEFIRGNLSDLPETEGLKGEITVVLGPPAEQGRTGEGELEIVLRREMERGGKPKEIARRTADRVEGWTAKAVYEKLGQYK